MKQTSKKNFKSAVSLLLMLAVVITGALAYFTASDSKKNVFTIGDVDIVLHEDDWTENEDGDSNHINGDNINVLPGDKISKAPYIENVGDNNAIVYMTIGIPTFQKDNSRLDPYAIAFDNTNIPVNAYAVQEMYGNLTDVNEIWEAYCQNEAADMFGTAVTDEAALLNRIELFNLPADLGSSWTQLGEVLKSEDGFNYYTFAYNIVIEPEAKTSEIIEWVQLNSALTENNDVLFSAGDKGTGFYAPVMNYYSKKNIGADKAAEIYGVPREGDIVFNGIQDGILDEEGNLIPNTHSEDIPSLYRYKYAGEIEPDYIPKENDAYFVSNANALLTFNSTSSQWEIEVSEETPIDADLIPDNILNHTATVIDPQADPDPNHTTPEIGDEYEDEDFIYKYGYYYNLKIGPYYGWEQHVYISGQCLGWGFRVKDTTKTAYSPIKNEIWGKPVTCANSAFQNCSNLVVTPKLSSNLIDMTYTFKSCTSLTIAPEIPNSVIYMEGTFRDCTSLTKAPKIPSNVIDMGNAFENCTSLVNPPDMSDAISVTDMDNTFDGCTSLVYPPDLSNATNVEKLFQTFDNCTSLISAPKIPNSVTNMDGAFWNCTSLITPPDMSNATSVTTMRNTFDGCTSLTNAPAIPSGVTNMKHTFYQCESLTAPPTIPNSVTNMYYTFYRCKSLTGTVRIPAGITAMTDCLTGTSEPITMEYYSSCTTAVNYSAPKNITKVCIDA